MIIKKLHVKNWGPHKEQDLILEGSVVGIVGSNGAGKSNLLQALDYALTGNLNKRTGQSYIRNYGTEGGATKASVYVEFYTQGKHGDIYREISTTASKRVLHWDGNTYTKADDVKKLMRDIVGADEHSLMNAAFIKQGDIDRLVKGTPEERKELFRKLVNLHFVDSRANDITSKIAGLKAGIVDKGALIAAAEELLDQRQTSLEEAMANMKRLQPVQDSKTLCARMSSITNDIRNHILLHERFVNDYCAWTDKLAEFTKDRPVKEIEANKRSLEAELHMLQADKNLLLQKEAAARSRKLLEEERDRLQNTIREDSDEWKILLAQLKDSRDFSKYDPSTYVQWSYKMFSVPDPMTVYIGSMSSIQYAAEKKDRAEKELNEAFVLTFDDGNLDEDVYRHNLTVQACDIKLTILEKGRQHETCPLCGSGITLTEADTKENLLKAREVALLQRDNASAELVKVRSEYATKEANLKMAEAELNREKEDQKQNRAKLKDWFLKLSAYMPEIIHQWMQDGELNLPEDIDALRKINETIEHHIIDWYDAYTKYQQTKDKSSTLEKKIIDNSHSLKRLERQLSSATEEELLLRHPEQISNLDDINIRIAAYQDSINTLNSTLNYISNCKERIQDAEENRDINQESLASDLATKMYIENDPVYAKALEVAGCAGIDWSSEVQEAVTNALSEYMQWNALARTYREDIESTQQTIDEYKRQQEENQDRLALISDLERIQQVVGKNGVPLMYMKKLFSSITSYVQELLERMDANFSVTADPERALTFRFVRTDNDSGHEMPQEQLSGGQAIRLSLALLIACQQVLLPQVGLLVLDEPSSHIDASGVASMRDMFANLSEYLSSANMQIILVDHNPDMMAAFDQVAKLSS